MKIATDGCEAPGSAVDNGACNTGSAATVGACSSLTKEIEDRMVRLGDGGVKLPETKEGREYTRESLAEDEQFWADRDESRSTKQGEWDTRCKFRTEEILAIMDTIQILIEDEALEVFVKTLPGVASRCRSRPPPRRGSRGLLQRCRTRRARSESTSSP